jgi:hypothetical protein
MPLDKDPLYPLLQAAAALAACEHPEDQRQQLLTHPQRHDIAERCSDCGAMRYPRQERGAAGELWTRPMLVAPVVGAVNGLSARTGEDGALEFVAGETDRLRPRWWVDAVAAHQESYVAKSLGSLVRHEEARDVQEREAIYKRGEFKLHAHRVVLVEDLRDRDGPDGPYEIRWECTCPKLLGSRKRVAWKEHAEACPTFVNELAQLVANAMRDLPEDTKATPHDCLRALLQAAGRLADDQTEARVCFLAGTRFQAMRNGAAVKP